jgi:hypothetical protein
MIGDGIAMIVISRYANQNALRKRFKRDISPPWSGNKEIKRERALTPNALILGKVGFMISLLCSQNRCIIGIARQRPEPHGLTWERLES